eukprot:8643525-Pyramimonas_sp.AAC.1
MAFPCQRGAARRRGRPPSGARSGSSGGADPRQDRAGSRCTRLRPARKLREPPDAVRRNERAR